MLRGRWHEIIVLNVHEAITNKCDDEIDSLYVKLGYVFDNRS